MSTEPCDCPSTPKNEIVEVIATSKGLSDTMSDFEFQTLVSGSMRRWNAQQPSQVTEIKRIMPDASVSDNGDGERPRDEAPQNPLLDDGHRESEALRENCPSDNNAESHAHTDLAYQGLRQAN